MSLNEFIKDCVRRGLSEEDMLFELKRRFTRSSISRFGIGRVKELYKAALQTTHTT